MPFITIKDWLSREKALGSPTPDRAVLATTSSKDGAAHSRVIAIREVAHEGILFFTQTGTRKVLEITENPLASMTFWLALQQRQIILEGLIKPLSQQDNEAYWRSLPRERQLQFCAYGPTSSQPIKSLSSLEERYHELIKFYEGKDIPMSEFYCGFRLKPDICYFYTLGRNNFSEVYMYTHNHDAWQRQMLSP